VLYFYCRGARRIVCHKLQSRNTGVWHQNEHADGPALRPDSPRSGRSAVRTVRGPDGPRLRIVD
jgi:hypothetical protein